MIVLHAMFPIDLNRRTEALDLIEDLAEQSRQEEGIIKYHATIDITDPHLIWFFELYKNEAAFTAHTETAHFREFEEALPRLLSGEPTIHQFEVEDVSDIKL